MIKLPLSGIVVLVGCLHARASIILTAIPDARGSSVSIRWNMVNYSSVTAYLLMRSTDGVVWQVVAANPVFRIYTSSTILAYSDKIIDRGKLYYRVRVYDRHDTVAISNTAIVQIPKSVYRPPAGAEQLASPVTNPLQNKSWKIFPNPVRNILNLSYKGDDRIMGVINLLISDATGKIVIKFRQASNNKQVRIPVSNLRAGLYFIKISVLNKMQMNEKFIKE
ncbi:MAG: T9SS type A sorting domain-containing protein [Ginsengibacter sp.]